VGTEWLSLPHLFNDTGRDGVPIKPMVRSEQSKRPDQRG
jgi:hypothetical protein